MSAISTAGYMLPLLAAQLTGQRQLARVPEPQAASNDAEQVLAYDQVLSSKLALLYAIGLEIVRRARHTDPRNVLDLACGPGHFSIALARHLGADQVLGVDLAPRMVSVARSNAQRFGLADRARFATGDVRELSGVDDRSMDLVTCTDAIHHLPEMDDVGRVLAEMDRVVRDDGLVFVMDVARLKSARQTDRYVRSVSHGYAARGLGPFLRDFHHSMYAAWTVDELRSAVPRDTRRVWVQMLPRFLPLVQILVGLPAERSKLFVRPRFARNPLIVDCLPIWRRRWGRVWAAASRFELQLLRQMLFRGEFRRC